MGLNIYDPKGFRTPYHPESNWRSIPRAEEAQPYAKSKKKDEREEEERKTSDFATDLIVKSKKEPRPPVPSRKDETIFASQIMRKPVLTLSENATLRQAWDLIQKRRFRHVPVVNASGRLVGILSDRAILREAAPFDKPAGYDFEQVKVKDVMSQPVLTAHPNTEISFIAKIFINEKIGAMPVIDQDHNILGIITRSDILRTLVKIDIFEMRI